MFNSLTRTVLAAALTLGAMTATTAEARDRYRDRGDDAALAIGAGIVGLALGAAIASNNNRDYYYDRYDGYYRTYPRYYYRSYPRGYYYDRYPRRDYRNYRGWDRSRDRGWDRRHYRGW